MRNSPFAARSWHPILYSGLVLLGAACGGITDVIQVYDITWFFINTSDQSVSFKYDDIGAGEGGSLDVSPHSSPYATSHGDYGSPTTSVSVEITAGAQSQKKILAAPVASGEETNITAVWNGTELSVVAAGGCASATSPQPASPLGASVCTAPTTWKLDGITGTATGNWQDQAATASGTLTLTIPQTVQEGETVAVSATFSGSLTVNPGWNGYSTNATVGINSLFGLSNVTNSSNTGPVTGSKSQSVTVNGAWAVPKNQATLSVEAGGNFTMAGTSPTLVATYSKMP